MYFCCNLHNKTKMLFFTCSDRRKLEQHPAHSHAPVCVCIRRVFLFCFVTCYLYISEVSISKKCVYLCYKLRPPTLSSRPCFRCYARASGRCFSVTPTGIFRPVCLPASEIGRGNLLGSGTASAPTDYGCATCCPWTWSGIGSAGCGYGTSGPWTWNGCGCGRVRPSGSAIWTWSRARGICSSAIATSWTQRWHCATWTDCGSLIGCGWNGATGTCCGSSDVGNVSGIGCSTSGTDRVRCVHWSPRYDRHGPRRGGCGARSARCRPASRWRSSCPSWSRTRRRLRSCAACGHRRT